MNWKLILRLIFITAGIVSSAVICSGAVSFLMKDPRYDALKLLLTGIVMLFMAAIGLLRTKIRTEEDRRAGYREAFAIVFFSWSAAIIAGTIPYMVVTKLFWYDALFETASGFTTTGISILEPGIRLYDGSTLVHGIESLNYGILFWRSLTHWLGGMGIVVLTLAILPLMNISGQVLYNAEVTGVKSTENQIAPRIASSAKILWIAYVFLTGLETVLLQAGNMTWFDAVCHSFSTMATGGFSTKQASIAFYNSAYIDWILIVFMFIGGCNFLLHYRFISGRPMQYLKDEEFRVYASLILISAVVIALLLSVQGTIVSDTVSKVDYLHNPLTSFRYALFQTVAIITTTGFTTANYCAWPAMAGVILFLLMVVGGCGGSTSGGLKCVRAMLLFKQSLSEIKRCFFPNILQNVRLNGVRMEDSTIQKTLAFFTLYLFVWGFFALVLPCLCPTMTFETSVSASMSCISNIGPGFAQIGPLYTAAWITAPAKIAMSIEMLFGRLELYTALVLFIPSFWKR